ncbi:hypothetical protein [Pseudobacteriovorax antillogorgiicola]|uniref:Polysaccharide lyase n=1 Tax=Pseudobacteriovorax antillogorgiicola TaxID=1513793 RepID=A0A1Y6CN16_9BACT|nr:hypothetical protein [Pseudobacteriovorax antillogorgiicola]TCS46944.1 hypothetical protein EDD56_12239 [Pseudobacteriovorax antillogorgiicola]SMF64460.1 hypothetical protein SAMN06296036_12239 [Pseudobacteriovorax antillogorgiicola]
MQNYRNVGTLILILGLHLSCSSHVFNHAVPTTTDVNGRQSSQSNSEIKSSDSSSQYDDSSSSNDLDESDSETEETPSDMGEELAFGPCENPDYILCIDFEDVEPGSAPQDTELGLNVEVVDSAGKQSAKSLHFYTNNKGLTYQSSYLKAANIPGKHWGRLYYKIENVANPSNYTHITFVAATNPNGYEVRLADTVRDPSGKIQYLYNFPDDQGGKSSAYNWTFDDKWICVEWQVDSDKQIYEFYRMGEKVGDISGSVAGDHGGIPENYEALLIGGQVYQQGPDVSGWIDDVVISTSRINCSEPEVN